MICPKCGFENNDTAKFCNECGSPLNSSVVESAEESFDEGLEQEAQVEDASSTAKLDIPPLFGDEDTEVRTDEEFDFAPIESESALENRSQLSEKMDDKGFDEYLIDSGYEPPAKSWKSGDTMEMPRVEGDEAPKQTEFRAPVEKKKMGRSKLIALVSIAVVVALALGAAAITYYLEIWGGKSIPDVVGMSEDEASEVLREQGFMVKMMEVKSDDTEDVVLLMDPGSGKRLAEGSEVVLQIATPRIVPETAGVDLEKFKESVEQEGFARVEYVKVKSDEPENTILSIEPASGTKAQASTLIKVGIAEPYIVPDVIGKDVVSAIEMVQAEGLKAQEYYVYTDAPEYTIVATDPGAGSKVASGSSVVLSVARSLSAELIATTQNYLDNAGSINLDGTNYEIVSVDGISYSGDNTTQAVVTVRAYTTLAGETVYGSSQQRTITFSWSEPHTDPLSYH
ncbi:MAG: PASTA domain-containing protein [Raoultibacter sp.]|jgi:beta-lactam-binding protein with PASTA domain